jgi:TonB family protein
MKGGDMKDHKELYGVYVRSGMLTSLTLTILVFLFVPSYEVEPYKSRVGIGDTLIVIEHFIKTTRPEPPVVKKTPLPPKIAEAGGGKDDVVTIGDAVFNELNPLSRPLANLRPVEYCKVEIKPRPIKTPPPAYPEILRELGIEGSCVLCGVIDTTGKVIEARVYHHSENRLFDEAALAAFRNYRFSPGYQRDHPVPVRIKMPFKFRLR